MSSKRSIDKADKAKRENSYQNGFVGNVWTNDIFNLDFRVGMTRQPTTKIILCFVLLAVAHQLIHIGRTLSATEPMMVSEKTVYNTSNTFVHAAPAPMDISFFDVAGIHNMHPHMAALNESGHNTSIHGGHRVNVTAAQQNPPLFRLAPRRLQRACRVRDGTYTMIHKKIRVASSQQLREQREHVRDKIDRAVTPIKLFCLVYTTAESGGHEKVQRILETWGQKCDGFLVGSTRTDSAVQAIHVPHYGPEEYQNVWQKVRSLWSYVYDNYYHDYDWFHIGGDDLYLIVENLRFFLESEEIQCASKGGSRNSSAWRNSSLQTPLFLGKRHRREGNFDDVYNDGGPGYTLNKAALKLLVVHGLSKYFLYDQKSEEDVLVAHIFRNFNVLPYETKDADGGERYNPFPPDRHLHYPLTRNNLRGIGYYGWYAQYAIDVKQGLNHSATYSVAFHYIIGDEMYRMHAFLYGMCSPPTNWDRVWPWTSAFSNILSWRDFS